MHLPHRRSARAAAGLVAATLLLAGCGDGDPAADDDGPSKADRACRADWKELEEEVEKRAEETHPSALSARWTNVAATINYQASTAGASGCEAAIEQQEKSIESLSAFAVKLAPYDMEKRLDDVREDAQAYADGSASPSPSPSPSPSKKGKKKAEVKQPPAPAAIARALATLTQQAPMATAQQGPGWQQADVIDLADTAAVAKTVKDLAFLSTESPAYQACQLALTQITQALKPVTTP